MPTMTYRCQNFVADSVFINVFVNVRIFGEKAKMPCLFMKEVGETSGNK